LSVRLKIDDRVFSRCRWQRTRSLGYLTVTQRLSVGRCLDDGSTWRTDARRWSSVNR